MAHHDTDHRPDSLDSRLQDVRRRIAAACERSGRNPDDVTLIGVTKTHGLDSVRASLEAGVVDIGESYVQELLEKEEAIGPAARWHYIGHLQRNKVRMIVPFVELIHAVDSPRLAREISKRSDRRDSDVPVLVQVNTSGEESKFGVDPGVALDLVDQIMQLEGVELRGMMTLAAYLDDPEEVRPMFADLRELRDRAQIEFSCDLPVLSMGMSNDFEVAVEEGATHVRLGTVLYGDRDYS